MNEIALDTDQLHRYSPKYNRYMYENLINWKNRSEFNYEDFLKIVTGVMDAGATGVAVGRNVWQHPDPLSITRKIKEVIFKGKRIV